jgi:hypothetical protein
MIRSATLRKKLAWSFHHCENVCLEKKYVDVNFKIFKLWELQDLERM